MDSYDLSCDHETLEYPLRPCGGIEFESVLTKFDTGTGQALSKKFLVTLSSLRRSIADKPADAPRYLNHLYTLYVTLSNDRSSYRTIGIPKFSWICCDGRERTSTCWRFELVMTGYAAGLFYLGEAFSKKDSKERLIELQKAYVVFRKVCTEECRGWTRMVLIELPLECTVQCCSFFSSLCLCLMQRIALSHKELDRWDAWNSPLRLTMWLFEESKLLASFVRSRIADGTGPFLSSLEEHVIPVLTTESSVLVLTYAAKGYITELSEEGAARAIKLSEYAEKFAGYRSSGLARHRCARHEESLSRITTFLRNVRKECDNVHAVMLGVGRRVEDLSEKEKKDVSVIWTLIPSKEPKFYRDLRKIGPYTPEAEISSSLFYNRRERQK